MRILRTSGIAASCRCIFASAISLLQRNEGGAAASLTLRLR